MHAGRDDTNIEGCRGRTQAGGDVGEGDPRVGQVDASQAGANDIVLQAHDQVVRLVSREHRRVGARHLPARNTTPQESTPSSTLPWESSVPLVCLLQHALTSRMIPAESRSGELAMKAQAFGKGGEVSRRPPPVS